MRRFKAGDFLPTITLESVNHGKISLPASSGNTHLQFRRFARCPMCNLHLHQYKSRASELAEANIQEVVVFHSTAECLLEYQKDIPFTMIADPGKQLYRQFAVQGSLWAVAHPVALATAIYAFFSGYRGTPTDDESINGLPAEFIINSQGEMLAVHYGRHGSDHWSIDEVIRKLKLIDTKKK